MLDRRNFCVDVLGLPIFTASLVLNADRKRSELAMDITSENKIVVTAAPDEVEIVVHAPPAFEGTYKIDIGRLTGGPINLVPPAVITEKTTTCTKLHVQSGLWIHDFGVVPSRSWQWKRDGIMHDNMVSDSCMLSFSDVHSSFTVIESLTDRFGSRSVESKAKLIVDCDLT